MSIDNSKAARLEDEEFRKWSEASRTEHGAEEPPTAD